MGHESIGVVEDVGSDVRTVKPGDLVVAPFAWSDGTCEFCQRGAADRLPARRLLGRPSVDGGQGEAVRVPLADGTLCPSRRSAPDDALMPSLLTLSDVMGTGHHAARRRRRSRPGKTVAVVGDGAVGLCGVIAAKRLGAEQIIILGRHADRIALAREFGATDVVSERGEEAVERVRELTGGLGAHSVLECVGHGQSIATALEIARAGRRRRPRRRPAARADPGAQADVLRERHRSPAAPRRCARTSTSCCPTSSKAGSSPAASSTASSTSTACPTATAR